MNTIVKNFKNHLNVGFIFLIPLFLIVIFYLIIPLFNIFSKSLTHYNFIEQSGYIGLQNYQAILNSDSTAKIGLYNTILTVFSATSMAIGASFLFAWLSKRLPNVMKYLLVVLFLFVSLTAIVPTGFEKMFSNDGVGYINTILLTHGNQTVDFFYNTTFLKTFMILVPILLGIGPLYLIFTIAFINKRKLKNYFHFAITLQIVIVFLSSLSIGIVTGNPSLLYKATLLPNVIMEYFYIRYEAGYGSALLVLTGIFLILTILIFNFMVWMIAYLISKQSKTKIQTSIEEKTLIHIIYDILIFLFQCFISFILMVPFLLMIMDSFKSIPDFFSFPQHLFAKDPTIKNYTDVLNNGINTFSFNSALWTSFLSLFLSTMSLFFLSILNGIGFSLLSKKIKRILLTGFTFSFVLSPMFLFPIKNYNLLNGTLNMTFKSLLFGISIYFSSIIFDHYKIKNQKNLMHYIFSILALSLLVSLSTWFTILYNLNKMTLLNVIVHITPTIGNYGPYTSFYLLSMIIPIIIVFGCVLYLMSELLSNHGKNDMTI